ncbi:hypothetical protein EDB85DRAFT_2278195 [Lactarius pseudohatsudake]|nr:hypothetical protein EDB85DRAFT_2278195 [Lactarius pseudohatsudake]
MSRPPFKFSRALAFEAWDLKLKGHQYFLLLCRHSDHSVPATRLIDLLPHLAASVSSSIYIHGDNTANVGVLPECRGYLALLHDSCLYVPLASRWCILIISLLDVVCFYDWLISLDQEVALIYPAPWNGVKAAYLFCRYYPMAIAPFHLWGSVGNHEQHVCESYYHALFACSMPTLLSAQFILMLRTYAFSGRKTRVLVALSITYLGLAGVIIWVLSKGLSLAPLFFFTKRNACLAISDEPNIAGLVASTLRGKILPAPIAHHVGMISELAAFFDCLNILVVLWVDDNHRMLVYVIMIALNALAICAFLRVLMLRQKASPTETKLRLEYSHMVDDALEMIAMDRCPEEISEGFTLSISTDAGAQH